MEFRQSYHELNQLRHPFETFQKREESKHLAEDKARLFTSQQVSTAEIIAEFLDFRKDSLDEGVPRRFQTLRDYLSEASAQARPPGRFVEDDIKDTCKDNEIALLDERQQHLRCPKESGNNCSQCMVFSESVKIPQLYERLKEPRQKYKAEKRIQFIPNLTSAGALALVATVSRSSVIPLRTFLQRYLRRQHRFSILRESWGFNLEFHIPYYTIRAGHSLDDPRKLRGKSLRRNEELPLRAWSRDRKAIHFYEAQTSSLSLGPDETFWTELFLVDTYFGSEEGLYQYFEDCEYGEGFDPPLGGVGTMSNPCYDPREYFLLKLDRRILQATIEYTALVDAFDERMEDYDKATSVLSTDTRDKKHTVTLSDVIAKIQLFASCIDSLIDAWESFWATRQRYFTTFGKAEWQRPIENINETIMELARLRKLLLTKRDRFETKLRNLSTVSSLVEATEAKEQTRIANIVGEKIGTLTEMTVYVAFPLLFSTAVFGMNFMKPSYPWAWFIAVLAGISSLNYLLASHRSPVRRWLRNLLAD
ncbi:hypothetical protein BDV96DRAFT_595374 [Lophiotrema nucula]|uniref:Cora-like Mg2+ transporter protein-domain-containing protein n=1 Tax=Lophiotrema nucula TaxID=690887 RepID=A0A6A5ZP36_9PLEO|nr:hypothetical protein BDV96DRAFT_595374 [Lophiotrema nucula]